MISPGTIAALALFLPAALLGGSEAAAAERAVPRLTILFDNVPAVEGPETSGGYACLIEGLQKTILFDTGADGGILLSNMQKLGVDPAGVDVVFLSHLHGDHTRGLQAFLGRNADVEVWMPAYFPESLRDQVRTAGARLRTVEGPLEIFAGAYTTGPLGRQIVEQALVLDTGPGLTLITGCAHPNIADIVTEVRRRHQKPVELIAGGFHLRDLEAGEFGEVLRTLEENEVQRVAPSHCTGDQAVAAFRRIWGERFVEAGCGTVIELGPELKAAGPGH